MPFIDNITQYSVVDKYWNLVKKTLCKVFKAETDLGDALRKEVSHRPADEQLLFYHAEPLDVAADLADEQPDNIQVEKYCAVADQCDWR